MNCQLTPVMASRNSRGKMPRIVRWRFELNSVMGDAHIECSPIGVLIGIQPWNYPYYQLARFVAPNLMAGNVILLKHAPGVPQCALAFERILIEAGLPAGAYT